VECLGSILKAELTLDQEGLELFWICAIEGVWFMDFGMGGGGVVCLAGGAGEVVDSEGEIVEDS